MMSLDRRLDPSTDDYVRAAKGKWELCGSLENKIALSYKIARGSWEGDPELGHRFAEVERALDTDETLRRIEDIARDAVRWLLDSGELERVEAIAERYDRTKAAFEVACYDAAGGLVKFGPQYVAIGGG
jgi:phage gp46-like protein